MMLTALITAIAVASTPPLTLRVEGDGYLRFAVNGKPAYSKQATLYVVKDLLSTREGHPLLPQLKVPASAQRLESDLEGNIRVVTPAGKQGIGRIVLALFPSGTEFSTHGFLLSTNAKPSMGNPGEGINGVIRSSAETTGQANPAVLGDKVEIEVAPRSEVDKEIILLRDIASIRGGANDLRAKLATIEVGRAPIYGASKGISQTFVMANIRMAGVDPAKVILTVPQNALVVRRAQRITSEQFSDTAIQAAKKKLGLELPLYVEKPVNDFVAPTGDVELAPDDIQRTSSGISVTIWIKVNGQRVGSRYLTLSPEDGAIGVKSGDSVRIRLVSKGATIEVAGKAKTSAWVGETITVLAETGTTHTGVVRGGGLVEVKL